MLLAQSGYEDQYNGSLIVTPAPSSGGQLKATYTHDLLGRTTQQQDWLADGAGVAFDRAVTYDNAGRVTTETDVTRQGNDTLTSVVTNAYGSGATYALGAVVSSSSTNTRNGSAQPGTVTTTTYVWYDGAVQQGVSYNNGSSTYTTSYAYTATGALAGASVNDGRPRTVTVTNDALGKAIARDETSASTANPHERWYRFNGKQLGYVGNNGTEDTSYAASIGDRTRSPGTGPFRGGAAAGAAYADFDQNYAPINSYEQGSGGGSYTVRTGDSLGGIAYALWGDASLWYKLAQANGLGADTALAAGQVLTVPAGVTKSGNTATTANPYNSADAYGDTSPTTPAPQAAQKKNKCGVFGQILLVVIAVAVTIWATPASPSFWQAAAGAAIGSTVSQAVGVATGIQDRFDWKGVALSAISAGVATGIGQVVGQSAVFSNKLATDIVRGALGSAITQGIGIATGLQAKFDWAGVAAAGIGAPDGQQLAANTAGGIANAATRSLANGTDFGDNLMAALPDIIGNTVGSSFAGLVNGGISATVDRNRQIMAGSRDTAARLAEIKADQLGLPQGSQARADFIASLRPYVRTLGKKIFSARRTQDPRRIEDAAEYAEEKVLGTSKSGASSASQPAPVGSDITITEDSILRGIELQMTPETRGVYLDAVQVLQDQKYAYEDSHEGWTQNILPAERRMALEYWIKTPFVGAESTMLDSVPGVGAFKSAVQVGTARDIVTGYPVSRGSQILATGLGLVPFGKSIFGAGRKFLGAAAETATGAAKGAPAIAEIGTPWGPALQSSVPEALAARSAVESGAPLYRLGTIGRSEAADAQFWAMEHPLSPGYAGRYGIPPENVAKFDFIESATLKPGTPFVTRPAPRIGSNPGGGIEVVVPKNGVTMKYFGGH